VIGNSKHVAAERFQVEAGLRPIGLAVASQINRDESKPGEIEVLEDFAPRVARARATPAVQSDDGRRRALSRCGPVTSVAIALSLLLAYRMPRSGRRWK
jgi:hypothetical protein